MVMASSSTTAAQSASRGGANPLAELTDRFRSLEVGVREWMAKQPTHIEAAVTTAFGAVQGGALGGLMGTFAPEGGAGLPVPQPPPGLDPKAMATFKQAQVSSSPMYINPFVTDLHGDHHFWLFFCDLHIYLEHKAIDPLLIILKTSRVSTVLLFDFRPEISGFVIWNQANFVKDQIKIASTYYLLYACDVMAFPFRRHGFSFLVS